MTSETKTILERLGLYCRRYLPHMERHVSKAEISGDIKPLLEKMENCAYLDVIRSYRDEIKEAEGIMTRDG